MSVLRHQRREPSGMRQGPQTGLDGSLSARRAHTGDVAEHRAPGIAGRLGQDAAEGQPLDGSARALFDPRFGHDFASVRVHADSAANAAAAAAGAAAVTVGPDIYFRSGAYAPESPAGQRLLAHELAHVAQHERFGTPGTPDSPGAAAGPAAVDSVRQVATRADTSEREAEAAAQQVMAGQAVQVQAPPSAPIAPGLLDWVEDTASDAASAVGDVASDVGSAVSGAAGAAWDWTKGAASDVYAGMKANAGYIKEGEHWINSGIDWLEDKEKAGTSWLAEKAEGIPVLEQLANAGKSVVDTQAEITGGALRGVTGLGGGLLSMAADPVDAARGIEAMAEHVPMLPGVPNPLKLAHGLLNVATGDESWGELGSSINPLTSTEQDLGFWKQVGGGLIGQYSEQWKEGKYADVMGHAGFDVASLFVGAGEANAAGKLGEAARLGEAADLARLGEAGDLAKLGEAGDLAKLGDTSDLARAADATDLAKAGDVADAGKLQDIAKAESEGVLAGGVRTPDQEFAEFLDMLREEGATGDFKAAGEPVTLVPYEGASEARDLLGVSGSDYQAAHGLPRSVGKHLPGYDPGAALTTLEQTPVHTAMDAGWKADFQAMRRAGDTTATAQQIYDTVAGSIGQSPLSPGMQESLKLRLQDEMFMEQGLTQSQPMTLPYPNIKPRP